MRRRRWIAWAVIVLLVAGGVAAGGYGTKATVSGSMTCGKCFMCWRYEYCKRFGVVYARSDEYTHSELPTLRTKEAVCKHVWFGCEFARSPLQMTISCSPGMKLSNEVLREIGWEDVVFRTDERSPAAAEYAWFVQEASGEPFGITYDDANRTPVVPPGAHKKIRQWWQENRSRLAPTTATAPVP